MSNKQLHHREEVRQHLLSLLDPPPRKTVWPYILWVMVGVISWGAHIWLILGIWLLINAALASRAVYKTSASYKNKEAKERRECEIALIREDERRRLWEAAQRKRVQKEWHAQDEEWRV